MKTTLTSLASSLAVLSVAAVASAQYGFYGYHHRSTAWGDAYSGASELVRAQGQFLKDEADAAKTWLEVDRGREAFRYEMGEWRRQAELAKQQAFLAKVEARKSALQQDAVARYADAQSLARDIRDGMPVWPAALRRPEYVTSVGLIESIIENWNAAGAPLDAAYRAALATELGVLEKRVKNNDQLEFSDRLAAVRTLHLLRELTAAEGPDAAQRLAMR